MIHFLPNVWKFEFEKRSSSINNQLLAHELCNENTFCRKPPINYNMNVTERKVHLYIKQ